MKLRLLIEELINESEILVNPSTKDMLKVDVEEIRFVAVNNKIDKSNTLFVGSSYSYFHGNILKKILKIKNINIKNIDYLFGYAEYIKEKKRFLCFDIRLKKENTKNFSWLKKYFILTKYVKKILRV